MYSYQHGEFFTAIKSENDKPTDATLNNFASGITRHAVIEMPDGSGRIIEGVFPPDKALSIFG
jgi:hypothetical protein